MSSERPPADPPGSSLVARKLARAAWAPVERFLHVEAASGIVLLAAAAVALIWANSPWRESYAALWHLPIALRVGSFAFERDAHFWVNDGVMTIFFFVVGLEIRREIRHGELSSVRRAALPLAAAVGGMLVPAGIYAALNHGHGSFHGWGIPMATDIAFAVGVLSLLGSRVPAALRILLLALAVIDDVGAILVIALFYSSGFAPLGFGVLAAGLVVILAWQALGVRDPWLYVPPAILVWAGTYMAGIHPTLAGVVVGLLTPVTPWPERETLAPVESIERALHGWVAFGAMPLFALANAGVTVSDASFAGEPKLAFLGITLGLVLGKPLGVVAFSWLATRAGLAELPRGIGWLQLSLVGLVAGIGFTMSIFIAALAFPRGAILETSKVAILVASTVAAVVAYVVGRATFRAKAPAAAVTAGAG
jgi:Na+:H+ antiporter, NhaA family